jgi:hypothetical protein
METEVKIKNLLIYYLKYRTIVFPIHEYLPHLADNIIKNFKEWGLEDNLITQKEKYFKYFLEKEIDVILDMFKMMFHRLNVKILTVYKETSLDKEYQIWFENSDLFSTSVKKIFKKKTKYFKELKKCNLLFKNYKGEFKSIKCGEPTGEEIEFLQKTVDKLLYPNN